MSDNMIIHNKLDRVKIKNVIDLKKDVEFNTKRIRVTRGKPGVYRHTNWNEWSAEKRDRFKSNFDPELVNKSVIGWFLQIPADIGNLPYNDTWVNADMAGTVYSYALQPDTQIILNGMKFVLDEGQGIKFSLKIPHEIPASQNEQNWACMMCFE